MHQAVLLTEVMAWLRPRPGGVFVDGTLGGGGHTGAIAEAIAPTGRVMALDQDAGALDRARRNLGERVTRCTLVQGSFARMDELATAHGFTTVDGVLLDIGISSDQLDDSERGFSFMREGPLDMRMDLSRPVTAADLLNTLGEEALAHLFRRYGEEPRARAIAGRVVRQRMAEPFRSTRQLADLVEAVYGGRRGRIHPATLVFQALRIAVNGELEAL
jgi:16S rRNA (cytosine1402-N4)-methyltransferase